MQHEESKREFSRNPKSKTAVLILGLFGSFGPLLGASPFSDDPELARQIGACLSDPNLSGAEVSVIFQALETGEIVFERNADEPRIPASNTKLITSSAALLVLGPDWHFETRVLKSGPVDESGRLDGDLVLKGGGDPFANHPTLGLSPLDSMDSLAAQVRSAGITRVLGDLIFDSSCFDDDWIGGGWPSDQLHRTYCAPVSGLSFFGNCFTLECDPSQGRADLQIFPSGAPFSISPSVSLVDQRGVNQIAISRPGEDGRVRVSGKTTRNGPKSAFEVPVINPPEFTAGVFLDALKKAGVEVDGSNRQGIGEGDLVAIHRTPILPSLCAVNKESDNAVAEHLFKCLGFQRLGVGTFDAGQAVVGHMLESLRVPGPARFVDGSGLSRENQITARGLVSLLNWMYRSPYREPYLRSLAISGVDGTLEKRMGGEMENRVRGKTGFLSRVSALSGYLHTNDRSFVFSILFNGFRTGNDRMKRLQDRICEVVANCEAVILK